MKWCRTILNDQIKESSHRKNNSHICDNNTHIFGCSCEYKSIYSQLRVDGFSSVTPQTSNAPTADNKTIQTNLNTAVEINLTAKPPPTVNDVPMTVNGSPNYGNNLVDPFGVREIYPTAAGGEQCVYTI